METTFKNIWTALLGVNVKAMPLSRKLSPFLHWLVFGQLYTSSKYFWRRTSNEKMLSIRTFSWLNIGGGGPSLLWMVPSSLGRWPWMYRKSEWASHAEPTSKQYALQCLPPGSCLVLLPMTSLDDELQAIRWTQVGLGHSDLSRQ